MSKHTIVQVGEKVLRTVAQEIPITEIRGEKIQSILKMMKETLSAEPDGAALAAPQVGLPLRIFILAERVFTPHTQDETEGPKKGPNLVYINPVIRKRSKTKRAMDEGCLSVRGKYGTIVRSTNVTIEAYDEHGVKFTRGAGGLMAQAFQHETDHLNGALFIDTAQDVWEVEPTKR
jgi:peptide deformylase